MSGPSMAAATSHSNSDDEESWISYIEKSFSSHVDGRSASVVSTFRMPSMVVEASKNRRAYVPTRVSLGPYHHGSAGLAAIEQHKPRALCRMMNRFNGEQPHPGPINMDSPVHAKNVVVREPYDVKVEHEGEILNGEQPDPGPINRDFAVRARNAIVQVQEVIKNNYDGKVEHEGEILSKILILDGCFILEIMRVLDRQVPYEKYDPLFERKRLLAVECDLLADILKLENQIPLIVLQKLLQLELQEEDVTDTLCQMVLRFLLTFYPFEIQEMKAYVDDGHLLSIFKQRLLLEDQGHHLLEFFRTLVVFAPFGDAGNNSVSIDVVNTGGEHALYTMLSNQWDDDAVDGERERKSHSLRCSSCLCFCQLPCWLCTQIVSLFSHNGGKHESNVAADIPRAVDLANAGVKFRKCVGGIKDIYFEPKSATMYLPEITVQDWTELAFLNLMAFELQKRFKINYVINYMYLMKKLMVSEEDVVLLEREGVLSNLLGTGKEVAELFNNMSKGVVIDLKDFMDGLAGQVMVHRNNKCNRYRAALLNEYFSTPWKTLGVVTATLLLALTIVQTIFTILALYK